MPACAKRRDRQPSAVYRFTHLHASAKWLVIRPVDANGKQLHAFARLPDGRFSLDVS